MEKPKNKKKLGGYPAVGVVMSIYLALFVIGLFGTLLIYSNRLEKMVRNNIKMQVYLKSSVTETQRLQIENRLLALDFVTKKEGQEKPVVFVSKEEAAKTFIDQTGEDFTSFIGDNPLKDALLVSIDPAHHSKEEMEKIKKDIQAMTGVFEVFYVEGLIESINENITKISLVLLGLVMLLLITAVLLINNTLRLALFSQRFLIRSMQLVGAKKWFINKPFILRAAGYGFLAATLASLSLWGLTQYANTKIEDLILLQNNSQLFLLSCVLLVIGMLVAVASTYAAMRRYLRMSLDELY
jgi:cell division transport system permease protein